MDDLIKEILATTDAEANPYFEALRDGSFTKEDFVETQVQFYNAVAFFGRPMAAVAVKIPDPAARIEILRNVWEEHGEGQRTLFHETTFLTFLERLAGLSARDVDARALWPEVRQFNTMLVGACVLDDHVIGVGALGMIECMFADISSWIGRAVIEREWLDEELLTHYKLHTTLDVKHSADFFDVLRPSWNANRPDRYFIEQGLRLGAFAFNSLYEGLFRARGRRWLREVGGPHTLAR